MHCENMPQTETVQQWTGLEIVHYHFIAPCGYNGYTVTGVLDTA